MSEENKYGTVTIGAGEPQPKELDIENFIQATFKDNRVVSVAELEDGTYVICIENTESSGRTPVSTLRLSKESLMGLTATILFYFNCKRVDIMAEINESVSRSHVDYSFSDNLKPFDKEFNSSTKPPKEKEGGTMSENQQQYCISARRRSDNKTMAITGPMTKDKVKTFPLRRGIEKEYKYFRVSKYPFRDHYKGGRK